MISEKTLKNGEKRYVARIYLNKKTKYIGTFKSLENAQEAFNKLNNIAKKEKIIIQSQEGDWRKDRRYRIWKVLCKRRDKVCLLCGSRKKREVHHKKNGAAHPKYRFDVENGVTLCRSCHTAFHCMYKHSFRERCTEKDWNNFNDLINYIKEIK